MSAKSSSLGSWVMATTALLRSRFIDSTKSSGMAVDRVTPLSCSQPSWYSVRGSHTVTW